MKKLTQEEVKNLLGCKPQELTIDQLEFLFYILSFSLKEYTEDEYSIRFEVHFKAHYIAYISIPKQKGLMSIGNEFYPQLFDGCYGLSCQKPKNIIETITFFVNIFYDNILEMAEYSAYFNEYNSYFDSLEEANEYLGIIQNYTED